MLWGATKQMAACLFVCMSWSKHQLAIHTDSWYLKDNIHFSPQLDSVKLLEHTCTAAYHGARVGKWANVKNWLIKINSNLLSNTIPEVVNLKQTLVSHSSYIRQMLAAPPVHLTKDRFLIPPSLPSLRITLDSIPIKYFIHVKNILLFHVIVNHITLELNIVSMNLQQSFVSSLLC